MYILIKKPSEDGGNPGCDRCKTPDLNIKYDGYFHCYTCKYNKCHECAIKEGYKFGETEFISGQDFRDYDSYREIRKRLRSEGDNHKVYICFFDMDNMKSWNKFLGQDTTDILIDECFGKM